jgi:hypothetical protein
MQMVPLHFSVAGEHFLPHTPQLLIEVRSTHVVPPQRSQLSGCTSVDGTESAAASPDAESIEAVSIEASDDGAVK